MDGISLFFMDVWTFTFSQVGLLALGWIARGIYTERWVK